MANKENTSPRTERGHQPNDGRITGAVAHKFSHWQRSALNYSPPLSLLSPGSKPSLARQRDHSACHAADATLRVRKTRADCKEASIYADVPPPCLHSPALTHDCCFPPRPSGSTTPSELNIETAVALDDRFDCSGCTLVPGTADENAFGPPPTPGRMARHKSISRRMISKMKEGIANRSRSSGSMRPTETGNIVMRRLSAKRTQSTEEHSKLRTFEISRDSIVGDYYGQEQDSEASTTQRSFSDCNTSYTDDLINFTACTTPPSLISRVNNSPGENSAREVPPSPCRRPTSPNDEPTPRPSSKTAALNLGIDSMSHYFVVPHVVLHISTDQATVDAGLSRDVWISVDATVSSRKVDPQADLQDFGCVPGSPIMIGAIPSLRLCYKPMEHCRVLEVIGDKAVRDLKLGQVCTLFLKVHIPSIDVPETGSEKGQETDSLFAELESIVGTLETSFLHVEARYRHSLLPGDNVVTLRHICTIRRPRTDSQWNVAGAGGDLSSKIEVHTKLVQYLAAHYPPGKALRMVDRWSLQHSVPSEAIQRIRTQFEAQTLQISSTAANEQSGETSASEQPSVVITDIETMHSRIASLPPPPEEVAPLSPSKRKQRTQTSPSTSLILSSPKTTTAMIIPAHTADDKAPTETATATNTPPTATSHPAPKTTATTPSQDSARQLWTHIRRSSLSPAQLLALAPDRVQQLVAADEGLSALRHQALANKRSVGAETLKGWRWEGTGVGERRGGAGAGAGGVGEMPWM